MKSYKHQIKKNKLKIFHCWKKILPFLSEIFRTDITNQLQAFSCDYTLFSKTVLFINAERFLRGNLQKKKEMFFCIG